MKVFRVHCWIDVRADDKELANLIAQVQLSTLVDKTESIKRAGIPGTPKEISGR